MATTRSAHTDWTGDLLEGRGVVRLDASGMGEYAVSWPSRAEEPGGATGPEELIAAAHSACYSMALSHALTGAGTPPLRLRTSAEVTFQPGTDITGIHLTVAGVVPGLTPEALASAAEKAKENCPVSQALTGTTITLDAKLVKRTGAWSKGAAAPVGRGRGAPFARDRPGLPQFNPFITRQGHERPAVGIESSVSLLLCARPP